MSERARRWHRRFLVVCLYVLMFICGALQVAQSGDSATAIVCSWAMGAAGTLWAAANARHRGRALLHIVQVIMFFSWPIALPVYLMWSRGFRGAGWACLHVSALFLVYTVGFNAALAGHGLP